MRIGLLVSAATGVKKTKIDATEARELIKKEQKTTRGIHFVSEL
jgi:hypothetical protein